MHKKIHYNLEILYNKYSPFIISIIIVIYHILRFLTQWDLEWIEYIFFPSFLTSLHMYNSRQTFMFCKVHRCFVNYVVANVVACLISHYWIITYMNPYWFATVFIGTVTAMLLGLFYQQEEHGKINSGITQKNS